ncbi:MAG TPA: NUDIX domain-containing protein [Candidatus Saccharimonadales bacterium]|nr:NUDIX domain-containing protein [Candidatus Saccharimonadales bacterium]
MAKQSAGILLYRQGPGGVEVLLVHPGGPFWAKKDLGSWSAPKGEYISGEEPLAAAKREFAEEVGAPPPTGDYLDLGAVKQSSGKAVQLFAVAGDFDLERFHSNTFTMEWPPKSGVQQEFPECDRVAWVPLATAATKLVKGQAPFIGRLAEHLHINLATPEPPAQATLF